jgi:hypothetical protein
MKYSRARQGIKSEHNPKIGDMCLHQEEMVIIVTLMITVMVTTTVMGTQNKFVLNWRGFSLENVLSPSITAGDSSFVSKKLFILHIREV